MLDNSNQQSTSENRIPLVTIDTMGKNMKVHYQENKSTFMGSKGKAKACYQDGNKYVELIFRRQNDCVLITKIIKPPFQNKIIRREKLMLH